MRISTTTLESFRLFMQQDWMSEGELLATIRGEFVPTPKVKLGRAFGAVLEMPEPYRVANGYQCDGYFFADDVMTPALALMDRRGVFEAKATKAYGPCTVVAKADQIIGSHLIEHKTTLSAFDFSKYAEGYQWRFMADLFEPSLITYHVFCLWETPEGLVSLKSVESFNLFPYADCHEDCAALVEQFAAYATAKGLDGLLRQRQEAA